VGQKGANGYGLHDMSGNVYEWMQDCWNDSYQDAPTDGSVWQSGNCSKLVLRGGSWNFYPRYLRSSSRNSNYPDYRYYYYGFRIARTLSP
jgi:formylglycine-generating enzyme required for sulfatase activity